MITLNKLLNVIIVGTNLRRPGSLVVHKSKRSANGPTASNVEMVVIQSWGEVEGRYDDVDA